ncbi:hypothetical protein JTB14_025385 [Gonioctena quinquepunctata]|nr:hypothetical protein JTB14_025385 [Gonioctena quinquepunctata]
MIQPPVLEELIATQLTEELLDKYKIHGQKREQLREFQTEFTKKTKLREFKHRLVPLYPVVPQFDDSHKRIRGYAELGPSTNMSAFQEIAIKRKICRRSLEMKFKPTLDRIMEEARDEFLRITHDAGVNLKTKPIDPTCARFRPHPYKYMGKTENYSTFLSTQKELQKKFLLHQSLVQRVMQECCTLPEILFNISLLRNKPYDIKELDDVFAHYISDTETMLRKFYYRVAEMVEVDDTNLEPFVYQRLLKVCTGLLSVYISKSIQRTIDHVVEVTGLQDKVPYLKLSLRYSDNLVLYPNEQDVTFIYSLFLTNLVEVGQKFNVLEMLRIKDYPDEFIHLNIVDEYFSAALEKIGEHILRMFLPVEV